MGLFSKTVAVAFIDEATGNPIATSNVPLEQLPDTFELDTKLEMAGAPYVVVRANPLTKAEFANTKRLWVYLRRLEALDPKKILFSLPTISGAALPRTSAAPAGDGVVILHEDDWRQCEFVSTDQSGEISRELAEIRRIQAEEAAEVGWRKLHVRERITHPLPAGVTWSRVSELLGAVGPLGGVSFGQGNAVANAVGARFPDGVVVWGGVDAGSLSVLCVEKSEAASVATIAALERVADGLSCALVNWCRCQVYCRDVAIEHATGTWRT